MASNPGTGASVPQSVRSEITATEHNGAEYDEKASRKSSSSNSNIQNVDVVGEDAVPAPAPEEPSASQRPRSTQVVSWPENDPDNPYNWSGLRKAYVVFTGVVTVINSTLGSSLPSNAIPYIDREFNITNPQQSVLPISLFLIGYTFGPLIYAPMSEHHGRCRVTQSAFLVYTLFTLACALAPSYPALLIFRLICGVAASAPIVVTGGLYADVYSTPYARGRAMNLFMAATAWGPLFSPIISGYVSPNPALGWRWTFWVGLIVAGASWAPLLFLPETYGPVLLSRRAARLRAKTGDEGILSPHDVDRAEATWRETVTKLLFRPLRMLFLEPIVLSTSLYLSLAYAIFYINFEAYPIVFQELYGLEPGVSGLMFLPIGVGAVLAVFVFLAYERFLRRAKAQNRPWAMKEEAYRLPLAFLGGPLYVVALFWFGWTAREGVPFVVPMLSGIPFGMGFLLIFMALLNFLTDAYEVFAASALAATSMCRSVFGAVLPLAATRMYRVLGINWASSLLGFASLAMCCLPFLFFRWGEKIRMSSKFCQELKRKKEEEQEKRAEALQNDRTSGNEV